MIPDSLKFTGKDSRIKGLEKIKLLAELSANIKKVQKEYIGKQELSGRVPNILIGDYGYPNVNTGFLSATEYTQNDSPKEWKSDPGKYSIQKIIQLRQDLLNSKTNMHIKDFNSRFADKLKEVGLASKPVDAEIKFDKGISFASSFDKEVLPHGPSAQLKNLSITENPKVPVIVQKYESDTDFKAAGALVSMSKTGLDEHYLTKILSTGNLGVKEQRKIVPTKWSITAVDDTLGKNLSSSIKYFEDHPLSVLSGGYMGNYYIAIIFPGAWGYELFETYVGAGLQNPEQYESSTDYEGAYGRKDYASSTVGGYYAARLAVLEYMLKEKKKGSVLLLRFITDEYWAPLGVWVVREASRNCFSSPKLEFESKELALKYVSAFLKKKFNVSFVTIHKKSRLLKELSTQKTLSSY